MAHDDITTETVTWARTHDWFAGTDGPAILMRDVATAHTMQALEAEGYIAIREYQVGYWSGERLLRFTSARALRAAAGY